MGMPLTPEQIQAIAAILGLIGGGGVAWWRLSSKFFAFVGAQNSLAEAIERLRSAQIAHVKRAGDRLDLLSRSIGSLDKDTATLSALVSEREKDTTRLEAQLEQLATMVVKQVASVNAACASLDAVWRTLQVLHPDRVPKRAGDR